MLRTVYFKYFTLIILNCYVESDSCILRHCFIAVHEVRVVLSIRPLYAHVH
jgi:hypothetical protein